MNLSRPFQLLSKKEKLIHGISWIFGLILINIPKWKVTMGNFHSDDYSLIIPSIYGVVLNAFLFYGNGRLVVDILRKDRVQFIKKSVSLLLVVSLLEASLDICYYYAFYGQIPNIVISETLWGQLLMNGIFFYIPSFVFGFAKAWSNANTEEPPIIIKHGNETVSLKNHLLTHLESDGNYCIYHADKKYLIRQSLLHAEKELPAQFIRSHKSFIINIKLVTKYTYQDVTVGSFQLPIGRKYRENIKSALG